MAIFLKVWHLGRLQLPYGISLPIIVHLEMLGETSCKRLAANYQYTLTTYRTTTQVGMRPTHSLLTKASAWRVIQGQKKENSMRRISLKAASCLPQTKGFQLL